MIEGSLTISFLNQELVLLKEKAIYWKDQSILLLSDLHLGKVGHFRKEGLAVPKQSAGQELEVLDRLLKSLDVREIIFAGDFSHSVYNPELEAFLSWREKYQSVSMVLVKGNHDILPSSFYVRSGLKIVDESLELNPFLISHKPLENEKLYNIAGHIHPGVSLKGRARQRITLSCFYFGKNYALLPAFGSFTGKCLIDVKEGDRVYVLTENSVKEV
jgi:DNA ligase-associated metallophosphoesterase